MDIEQMRQRLEGGGVTVAVAPLLYPTPMDVARKMVDYADITPCSKVLEPSAGTGNLIKAVREVDKVGHITAVEIDHNLVQGLSTDHVTMGDFLEVRPAYEGNASIIVKDLPHAYYDYVIMNPPFNGGADIKHIQHAMKFLHSGGTLVAVLANGPRQQRAFKDICIHWEDLPQGTFKSSGTNVNTAVVTLQK